MPDYRETLRRIRTFPSLIKFLQEKLDWPIISGDFEELTFDYTPEELGIDDANAAKIREIKRLRPLEVNQPWGIFFVMFEPKRLPVVALRRILSRVVLKKRASANRAESAAWQADDLLFVSNYGEGDERQISFAHFAQHGQKNDLPTLKVLGWDNLDTPLHLDYVADELVGKLFWPDDPDDLEKWRKTWRSAFTLRHGEVINTSKDLAVRLAELARAIRDRIKTVLAIETANGPLTKLMKAFQEALVHDLDSDGFADMYAQTIAYGLLSARVENPQGKTADDLAAQMTNPFLKELMETFLHVGGRKAKTGGGPGLDFDELGVSEVVELLDAANMEAVVRDFGDLKPEEDPVIHFYELFLKEYDAKKKMQRGVFYTPRPVVSYIVRSVDELMRTEFGLADGLADTATWGKMVARYPGLKIPPGTKPDEAFVQILDPATGTGTFLVEVIDVIHKTMTKKWQAQGQDARKIEQLWNDYVPQHLLPRLYGYELLMAPYAIAHMKIGLKLYETGYRFGSDERVRVYLTNALEPAQDFSGRFASMIPALAHEAQAVNAIKQQKRFTVIIGNPPYFGEAGRGDSWIANLMRGVDIQTGDRTQNYFEVDGKPLGERNPKWLNDDYVKFIRFSEWQVEKSGLGILSFITNHSYLDAPTFRGMRQSLMKTFSQIHLYDLHGSIKIKAKVPDGGKDENVFDIEQGVAINICLRVPAKIAMCDVTNNDLFGQRQAKYDVLIREDCTSSEWNRLTPVNDFYLFIQQKSKLQHEYNNGWKLSEIFPVNSVGTVTARDKLTIHETPEDIWRVVQDFVELPAEKARYKYDLGKDTRDWKVALAQQDLKTSGPSKKLLTHILYRPFDHRWTYYTGHSRGFICMPRPEVMYHMLVGENLAFHICRQIVSDCWCHILVTKCLTDICYVSNKTREVGYTHPLYLYGLHGGLKFGNDREPNISSAFLNELADILRLKQTKPHDLFISLTPEDIFYYTYAVFHSPSYRNRYAEFLKIDFPRLPLTSSLELFRALARLGGDLVALHLVEAPVQQALSARYDQSARAWRYDVTPGGHRLPVALTFTGPAAPVVEKVGWSDDTVWLDAAATKKGQPATPGTIGFHGVPEEVWNFHIGGYQVCQKWLKDRKGRNLSADDLTHYHRIVIALHETIRLMREIDEVINQHGGWPAAFQVKGET